MAAPTADPDRRPDEEISGTPLWVKAFGIIALIVVVLVMVVLIIGGGHGPARHTP